MKQILEYLFEQHTLTREQARNILVEISGGQHHPYQVSAFLAVFRLRGITVDELSGFRDALLELCIPVDLEGYEAIDLCGTGGDGKDTFNISTLAAFVAAGAGVHVAKHGNYAVSSSCGSSNVMEQLGYRFTNDPAALQTQLERSGICFLHAPLFHPAMKEVAPIRKSMGVRTFFNMLGPMVNPSRPKHQMVGVFSLELLRYYQYIYQDSGTEYRLVHSLDGYDEVSLTGPVRIIRPQGEQMLEPADFGSPRLAPETLFGGSTVADAAAIFLDILEGRGTPAQNAAVCANAAVAIQSRHPEKTLEETIALSRESLEGGKALQALNTLLRT